MDYKQFKNQLNTNTKQELAQSMLENIKRYFKSSFGLCAVVWFPIIMVVSLLLGLLIKVMISAESTALIIFAAIFFLCIAFLLSAYVISDLRKTFLLRKAINNRDYCIVDGLVTNISVDRMATVDTRIHTANESVVDFTFDTFDYHSIVNKRLKTNEWPSIQLVCTDYGIFTFFHDEDKIVMLATQS
jgi:hypothetical protein